MRPASYQLGFAPRDGIPAFPSLHRGCVRLWSPCLGPSGLTLRDWSGFQANGSLTNMDPLTDWVISRGRYCLDFDGTNDSVTTTRNSALTVSNDLTVEFWIVMRTQSKNIVTIVDFDHGGGDHGWTVQSEGATAAGKYYFVYYDGSGYRPISGASEGVVIPAGISHVAYTKQGTTVTGYLNGVPTWTPTPAGTSTIVKTATKEFRIGDVVNTSFGSRACNCQILHLGVYQRALSQNEIKISALRPGVMLELALRRRASSGIAFNRRRRLLVGAGS